MNYRIIHLVQTKFIGIRHNDSLTFYFCFERVSIGNPILTMEFPFVFD
ncbi:hypothetical protein LEP1GSC062_0218 [Leptospira alexanderi serovar Manhao 3 str. L 60]|uniref:Uncharacterized protein n=1 Tax=Leptospira alexanderi serovar Manhao 3 str. L 60 TaxID=1049759 RepID=V6IAA4_9LEPT|nr:hypothetical protein LEP1GSC062_0218 [Leptospira alexanderi serovar Manhao 3 str. L 60]